MKKATIPLLIGLFVVLGVAAGRRALRPAVKGSAAPEPASCRLVLAPLSGDKPVDREIAHQQSLALGGSSSALERLGWTFVKKARLSFDAGFYKLAEQCAACIEAHSSNRAEALLLRAHALQSLHHFAEAESAARELVRLRERPFDYGVLGDVLIDQGKVREGAAAYQKMVDLRPDLQSYARAAHVRWLTGDLDGAIELMKLATAASSPNDPEAGAWVFTRLALYQLQRGNTNSALASCDAALSLQSDHAPAMLARGRILLAMNRRADALFELQRAAKLNPLPEYQWVLEDALNVKTQQIVARSYTEDPRTLSLYLATRHEDVERAVMLAQQELTNRGDVFTHDALAWALAAAGRANEAQQQITQALSEGTVDSRLYLHAGVIAALNNDNEQARRWLDKAALIQQTLFPSERALLVGWRETIKQLKKGVNRNA
jgi:tetratricopeptide (TPR) repeat protein